MGQLLRLLPEMCTTTWFIDSPLVSCHLHECLPLLAGKIYVYDTGSSPPLRDIVKVSSCKRRAWNCLHLLRLPQHLRYHHCNHTAVFKIGARPWTIRFGVMQDSHHRRCRITSPQGTWSMCRGTSPQATERESLVIALCELFAFH